VVIPTYNRASLVVAAVGSVLDQTIRNAEIIVVDDGSTDATEEALRRFSGSIRYLKQENAGPGPARNRGLQAATGEWVAFLDSDDRWLPEKLEVQIRETSRLQADLSFHDSRHRLPGGERFIPSWNTYVSRKALHRPALMTERIPDFYELLTRAAHLFLMSTLIVRREAIDRIGGFDPALRTNQDIDLYLRLAPRSTAAYINRVLAEYSPGPQRAFENASQKTSDPALRGKARVCSDRIASLRKSLADRMQNGDPAGARLAKEGILRQMRTLASLYRRSGRLDRALQVYWEYLQTAAAPLRLPVRGPGEAPAPPGGGKENRDPHEERA
jgi:glycosyltransferase involved in cell wall biosynthesis